ncbi:MAG: hypothetical protein KAR20_19760, partial [Candidatus Heimdallarchaeota archaeon]|nr:hypothetical protein [Candidatus Heimdallarchaeota archaeon]
MAPENNTEEVDYKAVERFNSWNISSKLYHRTVTPKWIGETDKFWYIEKSKDGKMFRFVDPETQKNELAFDHDFFAKELSILTGTEIKPLELPIYKIDYCED